MGREKEAAVKITYIMKRRLSVKHVGSLLYFCHYITIVYSLLIRKENEKMFGKKKEKREKREKREPRREKSKTSILFRKDKNAGD